MAPGPMRRALRGALRGVRYVRPVPPGAATGLVRQVYRQVERDFGLLAPPVALHSPSPDVLAAVWALLRETLIADGVTSRAEREAVAVAVSEANTCPYCVTVHRHALGALGGRETSTARSPAAAAELAAVAFTFEYLNRMVSVHLGQSPLPSGAPAALARLVLRPVTGVAPGAGAALLADVPVADIPWAAAAPARADAISRATAVIERRARTAVPAEVREVVRRAVAGQNPARVGRAWTEPLLADVPEADRGVGRLALLTALAPQQVDAAVVDAARGSGGSDDSDGTVVEITAWSALTAATARSPLPHTIGRTPS